MYNDNELLYLISENDDEALEKLIEKYKPLIKSKIYLFNIEDSKKDDALQIGMETLYKAIEFFQTEQRMSFNRFFELLLERKFIDMYRHDKQRNNIIYDDEIVNKAIDSYTIKETEKYYYFKNELSELEKVVFQKLYLEKKRISDIAKELSCDRKKVYDAINRIKRKSA